MAVPARARDHWNTVEDLGDLRAMPADKRCSYASCPEPGITALGGEDLCCDHFVLCSYEFLEQIDRERAKNGGGNAFFTNIKGSVDSCLRGALEVSMKVSTLDNLQKARLLDIMLWAGEHASRDKLGFAGSSPGQIGRSSYEKPAVRIRNSALPQ
jgi:hypothetical protein